MWGHVLALGLMAISLLAILHMQGVWPAAAPSFVAFAAMMDGMWSERLLGQIWWLAAVVLLTPLTAGLRRPRSAHPSGSSPSPSPGSIVLGGCGNMIMCVLMLPTHGAPVSTGAHHATGAGISLFPVIAMFHGLICLMQAARIARRGSSRAMVIEMTAMGGSMLAMAASML